MSFAGFQYDNFNISMLVTRCIIEPYTNMINSYHIITLAINKIDTNKSLSDRLNQSINQSSNQSINQSINQASKTWLSSSAIADICVDFVNCFCYIKKHHADAVCLISHYYLLWNHTQDTLKMTEKVKREIAQTNTAASSKPKWTIHKSVIILQCQLQLKHCITYNQASKSELHALTSVTLLIFSMLSAAHW